jgi:hypothetical protein
MRKVVTYIECDRCTFNQIVECKKNFFGYKMSQYPEDWKMMENDSLCPKCKKQWYGEYKKFMNKGKGKEGE